MSIRALDVDLEWDDTGIVPDLICPDTAFIFSRMTDATISAVGTDSKLTVLDVGCGCAIDALELARYSGRVIGLDPSGVMLGKAKGYVADAAVEIPLIQAIGEKLPLKSGSIDRIVCKGALDHFPDPSGTLEEMFRVLKPHGEVVISIANYESLSCRLGRLLYGVLRLFGGGSSGGRMMWEIPPDHMHKFDYGFLRQLVSSRFRIRKVTGVSLLWGIPYWGLLLSKLPGRLSSAILSVLDKFASKCPAISDVIIIRLSRSGNGSAPSRIAAHKEYGHPFP